MDGRGLKAWYAALLNASEAEAQSAGDALADQVLIPDMLVYANRRRAQGAFAGSLSEATYVDLGHHINLGLLEPLVRRLHAAVRAPRVSLMRVRRHRYDTVRSFASESKAPCSPTRNGMFTLCPVAHRVLLRPSDDVWRELERKSVEPAYSPLQNRE